MKNNILKVFTILIALLFVAGCSEKESTTIPNIINKNKTLECTKTEVDEDGYNSFETFLITYNSTKVLKAESISVMEADPEYLDMQISFGQAFAEVFNSINGMSIKYEKVNDSSFKLITEVDYNKLDPNQIKQVLGDMFDEEDSSLYSKNDYTIEDFKKDNLEGYDCK